MPKVRVIANVDAFSRGHVSVGIFNEAHARFSRFETRNDPRALETGEKTARDVDEDINRATLKGRRPATCYRFSG